MADIARMLEAGNADHWKGWCVMGRLFMRKVMMIVCVLVGIGGGLYAQGTRTPADGSTQDALLAEVRALRAEIHQMAGASIRAQLLVARLQLQEQRVFTAGRQLVEARNALAPIRQEIAGEQARVRQLEGAVSRAADQGIQQAILVAEAHIERQQTREHALQARETELLNALNDEQVRWADLNTRLDALERTLPGGVSR